MKYIFVLFFVIFYAGGAFAEPGYSEVNSGNRSFKAGDFKAAAGHYEQAAEKNPRQALIDYDRGTAYYKNGDYDKAVEYLQKGLLTDDKKAIKNVYYNLGNALYKLGISREDKDVQSAVKSLEEALPHYQKVLAQDPQDEDAKANDEFVKKELERLKKKQQQQQQNKAGSDSKKSDSSQDKKEQSSSPNDQKSGQDQKSQQQQGQQQDQQQGSEQKPQDQEQKNGEKKDDVSAKKNQGAQDGEKKPSDQQTSSSSGQAEPGQILSQKEAQMILDDFDQNEQPKGLANFIRKTGNERPVEKDW